MKDIEKTFEEFKKCNEPKSSKGSKLSPYSRFIMALNGDHYSHEQIVEFMKLIGVDACTSTIGRFIKKQSTDPEATQKAKTQVVNKPFGKEPKDLETGDNPLSNLKPIVGSKFNYDPTKAGNGDK